MTQYARKIFSPHVVLRIVLDLLTVHCCLLLAVALSVCAQGLVGRSDVAGRVASYFPYYYGQFFVPLSVIFPVVFALSGFYTRSRSYSNRWKQIALLRGTGIALLIYICANFLVFREELVPRSVLIVFAVLSMTAVTGSRFVKAALLKIPGHSASTVTASGQGLRNVLVVGGAGYIGSILVRNLLDRGTHVRILDNLTYGSGAIRDILNHPNLELMVGDCRNIQNVVGAVRGVDAVVHLAAIVGDPACDHDRQTALEVNYAATRMVLEVAKGQGISRFVFASSCSVYGKTDEMMDERSALNPVSLYAQTKIDSERALLEARTNSFHPTVLRLATVFGNSYRPRFDLVVNLLTAKAFQERLITIFNGQQWRPFIHVRDVAAGILVVLGAPLELISGQVFNLGDTRMNFTLFDVAEEVRKVFPETRLEHVENSDRRNYRVSFEKIRNHLGFVCHYELADGIKELRDAFSNSQILDYKEAYYSNQKYLQRQGTPANIADFDAGVMAAFSGPIYDPNERVAAAVV